MQLAFSNLIIILSLYNHQSPCGSAISVQPSSRMPKLFNFEQEGCEALDVQDGTLWNLWLSVHSQARAVEFGLSDQAWASTWAISAVVTYPGLIVNPSPPLISVCFLSSRKVRITFG